MVRLSLVGFAVVALIGAVAARGAAPPRPRPVTISEIGSATTVFSWGRQRCEDLDIPDSPARAFRDAHGRIDLIATHYHDRRFVGRDFNHLQQPCGLVMRSDENPDPATFADRGWIGATWTPDGTHVYALVHDEFDPCGFSCWYNAVTLAVSTNGGATYRAATPRLVASSPYPFSPETRGPSGIFAPTNIVRNPRDGYLYAIVQELQGPDDQGDCLIRTKTPGVASSWRAWSGGTGFRTAFANPYAGPVADPTAHLCMHIDTADGYNGGTLTYNTVAHQWLRVLQGGDGFYYALSSDLIHWTQPVLFFTRPWFGGWQPDQPAPAGYPSLIDPKSTSRNFDTSGATAYLYYTQFNYTGGNFDPLDRDLVRVAVTIR